ncbi:MAG: aminopeptidase [Promethearchaeota archaeon]|jgi:aminopeptidase
MINPIYEKYAQLVVNYSLNIKKGERVIILSPAMAEEFIRALYVEVLKAGAHPYLDIGIEGINELLFKYASEEQLLYVDDVHTYIYKEFDCLIMIKAKYNTKKLSLIHPKKLAKRQGSEKRKEQQKIVWERESKGEFRICGYIPFPCNSLAQEANMDLYSYTDFVTKAIFLDKENPIQEWKNLEKSTQKYVDYINKFEKIQVLGEDTDLEFSVKGRKWINACGHINLPDGEIYTSPVEDSVNGRIRFTYPGIYLGNEIENIYLEFKDGIVTTATAQKGEELLNEILKVENANIMGEFAIGTNYGIKQFTKDMMFDEKIGGTIHCGLGRGFKKAGSKNECAIHWDLLKDMRVPGSKILGDNEVIYEEGKWVIPNKD